MSQAINHHRTGAVVTGATELNCKRVNSSPMRVPQIVLSRRAA
jgi:hypothetical protein